MAAAGFEDFCGGEFWYCCLMLACLALVRLFVRAVGDALSRSPAAFLGDGLYITAYVLLAVMTRNERLKCIHTSPVTFFFWLLTSVCNVIPFYTYVIERLYNKDIVSFLVFMMSYALQLSSLGLTAFVEHKHPQCTCQRKQPCPETTCSFPSFLGFWWMNKLMITGYRRDIEESDLWLLPPKEQSSVLVPAFLKRWKKEQKRCRPFHSQASGMGKSVTDKHHSRSDSSETLPILHHDNLQHSSQHTSPEAKSAEARRPSLVRVIVRMLVKDFIICFLQKAVSDLFFLLSPVILGALIKYLAERPEGLEWQGYVLCVSMFLTLIIKSMLFAHAMFLAARLGIRMKSTLIAAVYRKALTMNNSTKNSATVGEIVNLMSVDAQRVQDVMIVIFYASTTPVLFVVAVMLLYFTIGPAIFVGVLLLVCCVPLNAYVVSRQRSLQSDNLKYKDARIRLYNEILNGIKVLKLYAWEPSFREKIREIRLKEVAILFKLAVLNTLMSLCWDMAPFLVTLVTFATYVLADRDNHLDAGQAFVSLSLFNVLRPPLAVLSKMIMYIILSQVSFKRLNTFLAEDDLDPSNVDRDSDNDAVLSILDGTFTWDTQLSPALNDAMLGEMEKVKGTVTCMGTIAYVPQQAWMQNASMRDNILFGMPYVRSRYRRTLEKCELERDLTILSAGDLTEIGEKGINLSGGQKQRVSVARAVYSDSDVYLLDDPLSAVDSHVGKAIFSNVIGPDGMLRGKTRVLVTHGVHWLPMVDEVIVMNDGKISERGSYEQLVSHDGPFAQFLKTYLTEVYEVEEEEDPEIAEIHGKMRERLGSVTSNASSEDITLANARRYFH
ncbi:hypothetical protein BaRGS_00021539 [Batillaria attramentaria]|uniref:Uncharacterized protein n=1 Tax=Batillaria attramentaria TaxID=370345 RepID=A0ABD0KJE2_9CAEN